MADACYLLESARTRALIGTEMKAVESPMPSVADMPACTRFNRTKDRYISVLVRMPPRVDAKASFEAGKSQLAADENFAELPGVGDGAYRTKTALGTKTLTYVYILKGDKFVSLTLTGFRDSELAALAKSIADQL